MSLPLEGKVAVVTGAGHGIGQTTAVELSRRGAAVVLVGRSDTVRDTHRLIKGDALDVIADISKEADVDRFIQAGRDAFGKIDLYFLNAGVAGPWTPLPDIDMVDADQVMNTNFRGSLMCLRAAFRQYRAQESGGSVVVNSSIHGLTGAADLPVYQMTKHALVGLVRTGAIYGGPIGVRVNGVAPGIIPVVRDDFRRASMAKRAVTGPMRRAGTTEEIATVVAFLLSDDASYVNGVILPVDGGASMVNVARSSGGAGAWDAAGFDKELYG